MPEAIPPVGIAAFARRLPIALVTAAFLLLPLKGFSQQLGAPTNPATDDFSQGEDSSMPALPGMPSALPTNPDDADQMMDQLYPDENAAPAPENNTADDRRGWKFLPTAGLGEVYDDNIFISHTNRHADFVTMLSGGFDFGLGDFDVREHNYAKVSYTGTGYLFGRDSSQDAYDQDAMLQGQEDLGAIQLQGEFHFQSLSGGDVDVGDRTRRQLYDTTLTANYNLDEKVFVQAQAISNIADYTTELDSENWLGRLSLNYKWSPKDVVALGAGGGVLQVQDSPDQTYEQVFVQTTYSLSEKLSVQGEAGLEFLQAPDLNRVVPILNIGLTYQPEAGTSIALNAYRRVENSASLTGDDDTSTGVGVDCHHLIGTSFDMALAGGYENDAYADFASGYGTGRTDDYFYLRPSIAWVLPRNRRVEVFYRLSHDASTLSDYSFRADQTGVQATLPF